MPADPDLYTRTFTWDELKQLSMTIGFTRRMLEAAGYPQETIDDLTTLSLRICGVDLPVEGIAA